MVIRLIGEDAIHFSVLVSILQNYEFQMTPEEMITNIEKQGLIEILPLENKHISTNSSVKTKTR